VARADGIRSTTRTSSKDGAARLAASGATRAVARPPGASSTGEEILIDDLDRDTRATWASNRCDVRRRPPARPGGRRDAGAASLMYVPVLVGQRVLGVLWCRASRARAYQRVHLDMLARWRPMSAWRSTTPTPTAS
jgi:GAF domain-containing protein